MRNYITLFVFFMICFSGCAPGPGIILSTTPTTQHIRERYTPSLDAFQTTSTCPHICWLGINPGITSGEDALRLVRSSDQLDQQFTRQTGSTIEAYWYTEKTKDYKANVYMTLSNDTVKSITISHMEPFTVDDFIHLLGIPTGISFHRGKYPYEGGEYAYYNLYFSYQEVRLTVKFSDVNGPKPNDLVDILELSPNPDNQPFQPWLGYRSLGEYFPNGTPTAKPPNPLE